MVLQSYNPPRGQLNVGQDAKVYQQNIGWGLPKLGCASYSHTHTGAEGCFRCSFPGGFRRWRG